MLVFKDIFEHLPPGQAAVFVLFNLCTNFSAFTDLSLRPEWVQKIGPAYAGPRISQITAPTAAHKSTIGAKNKENPQEIGGSLHAIWSPNRRPYMGCVDKKDTHGKRKYQVQNKTIFYFV